MPAILSKRITSLYPIVLIGLACAFYTMVFSTFPAAAGYDYRIWYAAAAVLHHGGNPYDMTQLYHQEMSLYHALPWMNAWQRWWLAQNPYVHGTMLAVLFMPALAWPHATVYPVVFTLLMLTIGAALFVLARLWPREGTRTWLLYLLLSPFAFVGPFLGQVDALFLLAFVLALRWIERCRFLPAGCILMIGLIKPQIIAGPVLVLLFLAWRRNGLRAYVLGLTLGLAAVLVLSAVVGSFHIVLFWLRGMLHFGSGTIYLQNDLSTLASLYIGWLPHALDLPVSLLLGAGWLATCLWLWRSVQTRDDERWWIACATVGWLLVTPYAHPHDDVLLFPAMWLLGTRIAPITPRLRWPTGLLFVAWWFFPLMNIIGINRLFPLPIRGFSVCAVLLLFYILVECGLAKRRRQTQSVVSLAAA